jgi:hypothetical protein
VTQLPSWPLNTRIFCRLWRRLTQAIQDKDMEAATEAKSAVEDAQREVRRKREEAGEAHQPRFFHLRDGRWLPKLTYVISSSNDTLTLTHSSRLRSHHTAYRPIRRKPSQAYNSGFGRPSQQERNNPNTRRLVFPFPSPLLYKLFALDRIILSHGMNSIMRSILSNQLQSFI